MDFERYMTKLDKEASHYGMVKVVPPARWSARKKGYSKVNITLSDPIRQEVQGLAGIYDVLLISEKPMDLKSYKTYASQRTPKSTNPEELEREVPSYIVLENHSVQFTGLWC